MTLNGVNLGAATVTYDGAKIVSKFFSDVTNETSCIGYARGGENMAHEFHGEIDSAKMLRKRAKAAEKREKADKKAANRARRAEIQREAEEADARSALMAVVNDSSRNGYARVWAARTILGLEGGE